MLLKMGLFSPHNPTEQCGECVGRLVKRRKGHYADGNQRTPAGAGSLPLGAVDDQRTLGYVASALNHAMGLSLFATAHCSAPNTAHGANFKFEPTYLR